LKSQNTIEKAREPAGSIAKVKSSFDWIKAGKYRSLYILLLFPIIYVFIFNYIPMYGVIIAFKDFKMGLGIIGSEWNNFEHFRELFTDYFFIRVLRNTLIINFYKIIFGFPAPIILALLLNEIGNLYFKKISQTISYLPHFLSWVVLAALFIEFLSPQTGPINYLLGLIGIKPIYFLASDRFFRSILVVTGIWQGIGWGSIIYLAAISAVNPELYEAAEIDGAGRFKRMKHITIPSIMPVVVLLWILRMGAILSSAFDQVFNLLNPVVYEVGDVIGTYVYRKGILQAQFAYGAAVGLFVNVVGIIALVATNYIAKRFSEYTLW
jgi:putative aldouronate transport system permease protein